MNRPIDAAPVALENSRSVREERLEHHTPVKSVVAVLFLSACACCSLAWTASQPDGHPLVFALGLSWVMACAGGATSQVFSRLGPKWFGLARWERDGKIYAWIGVGSFRWALRNTPLGWLGPLALRSGRSGLGRLLLDVNSAEGGHTVAAGLSLIIAGVYAVSGQSAIAVWLVLITIPLNIYPIILQRWNRGRVLRLHQRLDADETPRERPGLNLVDETTEQAISHGRRDQSR